jgi:hypothetical protein
LFDGDTYKGITKTNKADAANLDLENYDSLDYTWKKYMNEAVK